MTSYHDTTKKAAVTTAAVLLGLFGTLGANAQQPQNQKPDQTVSEAPSKSTAGGGIAPGQTGQSSPSVTPSPGPLPGVDGEHAHIERQQWTFGGLNGHFDQRQLQRGYKVYKTVCANCHNMRLMSFRNLGQPGGPEFSKETVEQIAAETQVPDETKPGEMRAGKPSDRFQWIYKNEKEAAAALGAIPPDLSVMAKARTVEREIAWYAFPVVLLRDLATQYQEQGSDYIYALLNGYREPPANKKIAEGLNYNIVYPGNQIAMKQPLEDGTVDYEEGEPKNTLDQQARDVTAFISWASEPHLVERKKFGLWVLIYLSVVIVLLYLSKQTLWHSRKS